MNGRMIILGLLPLGFATGSQPELRQGYLLHAAPLAA
jgi:hypothetical protein